MAYLTFTQIAPLIARASGGGITYDVTQTSTGFTWSAYLLYVNKPFTNASGVASTQALAESACEAHYEAFFNLQPQPAPPQPQFISTIPHVTGPMPGVDPYAQPYRMNRTNDWMPAEQYWVKLLNVPINAPKPDLNQYLWNPTYSWFADYQIDPNQPIPNPTPRPN